MVQNTQFGLKIKYAKNGSTSILHLFYAKKRLEKTANIRKMAIAHAKWAVWVKN